MQICQLEKALQVSKKELESHLAKEKETKENLHIIPVACERIPSLGVDKSSCTNDGLNNTIPLIARDVNTISDCCSNNGYIKLNNGTAIKSQSKFYINDCDRILELKDKLEKLKERNYYTEAELAETMKKFSQSQKENAVLSEEIDKLSEEKNQMIELLNRFTDSLERHRYVMHFRLRLCLSVSFSHTIVCLRIFL